MNEFSPQESADLADAIVEDMHLRAEEQGTTLEAMLLKAMKTQRGYSESSNPSTDI